MDSASPGLGVACTAPSPNRLSLKLEALASFGLMSLASRLSSWMPVFSFASCMNHCCHRKTRLLSNSLLVLSHCMHFLCSCSAYAAHSCELCYVGCQTQCMTPSPHEDSVNAHGCFCVKSREVKFAKQQSLFGSNVHSMSACADVYVFV